MRRTDVRGGGYTLRVQVLQVLQVLHALFMRVVEVRKKKQVLQKCYDKCYKHLKKGKT